MYYEVYEKGMVTSCTQYYHQWRTQKIFMGGFIQWQIVVICI